MTPVPPTGGWIIDRFSETGRPLVILNDPGYDRSAWWPTAARLGGDYLTVVASPTAVTLPLDTLALELARLGTRAPIVVGHLGTAAAAVHFGARFAVHAVVTVDLPISPEAATGPLARSLSRLHAPHLAVVGALPWPDYPEWLRRTGPSSRVAVVGGPRTCPHVADPRGFADAVRTVAGRP